MAKDTEKEQTKKVSKKKTKNSTSSKSTATKKTSKKTSNKDAKPKTKKTIKKKSTNKNIKKDDKQKNNLQKKNEIKEEKNQKAINEKKEEFNNLDRPKNEEKEVKAIEEASKETLNDFEIVDDKKNNKFVVEQNDVEIDEEKKEKIEQVKRKIDERKQEKISHIKKIDKRKKARKVVSIIAGCVLGIYLIGCLIFSYFCFPNTFLGSSDISFYSVASLHDELENRQDQYIFTAQGLDCEFKIEGKQINYNFDINQVIDAIISKKNPFAWPYEIFNKHDFADDAVVSYDRDAATNLANVAIEQHNSIAQKPVNASFSYDSSIGRVVVNPEVEGNTIDSEKAISAVLSSIGVGSTFLQLTKEHQQLPTLCSTSENCATALNVANTMMKAVLNFKLGETAIGTLTINEFSKWIELKESYVAGLNDSSLAYWISNVANQYNTVGKPRNFTTPYGKATSVVGGDNLGWEIDEYEMASLIENESKKGTTETLDAPCSSTLGPYVGVGVRDWGPRYIDVDLSEQHARLYDDNGSLIWESDIVSGKPITATPTGMYTIKQVRGYTVLKGNADPRTGSPAYESPVQHWMPFVGNMIGFHDASWQSKFGGNWYIDHGSKGCINLPSNLAASLSTVIKVGDIVIVHV